MKRQFILFLICFCSSIHLFAQIQLGNDIDGEDTDDQSGAAVSLSDDGNYVAIGAPFNEGNGTSSGHVRVYKWEANDWLQVGSDINGEASEDRSGFAVSMSSDGSRVAIGAPLNNNLAGHTRIYEWDGNNWTQLGTDIDGELANSWVGSSVSLSDNGNIVAIGAYRNDDNGDDAGQVQIFEWDGNNWIQLGTNINGEAANDWAGVSISLSADGHTLAIGASYNDDGGINAGNVKVYKWTNNNWVQLGTNINGESAENLSGWAVDLSDDASTLVIGAPYNFTSTATSGHARVFRWNGNSWQQIGSDIDGEALNDSFGQAVSLSADGNRVAVGGPTNSANNSYDSGHARVFDWNGNDWIQIGPDIDAEASGDNCGNSLSLSADGTRIAVGASGNDGGANNAGHVRIFELEPITTSIFDFPDYENNAVAISPNPFQSLINVEVTKINSSKVITFEIYDTLGKRLFSITERPNLALYQITFPEGTPSGMYFLKTKNGEEVIAVNRILKLPNQ